MLSVFIHFGDGRLSTDASPESLLAALRDEKAVFWLDMYSPSEEEYSLLDDIFGFHPLSIEDCMQYNVRPKIDRYTHTGEANPDPYYFIAIHGPDLQTFQENQQAKELDIFFSRRYLITVHDELHRPVTELADRAANDPELILDQGTDKLLHTILDTVVDHYEPILDYLEESLADLEDSALKDPRQALLSEIAMKKRELLNLRRTIAPQREVIAQLARGDVPFIRESIRLYFRDVQDHLIRVVETVEIYRELVLGVRDIYLSSLSNNLNQVMKILTTITVIALPMTVVTSMYGMNIPHMPFQDHPNGFWIVWGIIVALITTMLIVFHAKRWL